MTCHVPRDRLGKPVIKLSSELQPLSFLHLTGWRRRHESCIASRFWSDAVVNFPLPGMSTMRLLPSWPLLMTKWGHLTLISSPTPSDSPLLTRVTQHHSPGTFCFGSPCEYWSESDSAWAIFPCHSEGRVAIRKSFTRRSQCWAGIAAKLPLDAVVRLKNTLN